MKKILPFIIASIGYNSYAQNIDSVSTNSVEPLEWNYSMPIFGKKAAERGFHQLLPYGVNLNYINTKMELEVTDFTLTIGDNAAVNDILTEYVNEETLNFSSTTAFANGFNLRPDVMVFPFLSVYGIYALNQGYTEVSLQPTWYDDAGDLILELPVINSRVEYKAQTLGVGATLFYGYKNIFFSLDGNYSSTQSAILDRPAELITASARIGYNFDINKEKQQRLSFYVGLMTRNFLKPGSQGRVTIEEALPDLQDNIADAIVERKNFIENDQLPALQAESAQLQQDIDNAPITERPDLIKEKAVVDARITLAEYRVESLDNLNSKVVESDAFETEINYFIKKELVQPTTFEMGFNFQLSKNWMIRGEYGISGPQHFLMTGLQYRFGL